MRNTIFIGIFVLAIGMVVTWYVWDQLDDFEGVSLYLPGILVGIGLGLILGSLIGYSSKSKKLDKEQYHEEIEG